MWSFSLFGTERGTRGIQQEPHLPRYLDKDGKLSYLHYIS